MAAMTMLDEQECYLAAILDDPSGIDLAEFAFLDETPGKPDPCFRVRDYQWSWWSNEDRYQIDHCSRDVGKSQGIQLRAFAFPFNFPGQEMLITAPELNHLSPIVDKIEKLFLRVRLGREMLPAHKGRGVKRQPQFQMTFTNGSTIMGRLPNRDGRGVKGQHSHRLEMDEAQDYPQAGWTELVETMRDTAGAQWRAHGVSRGVRDMYYRLTNKEDPDLPFFVHRYMAMHRPGWSSAERKSKIAIYGGSRDNPDYKRNIYGEHGDITNPVFVLARLMACHLGDTLISLADGTAKAVQDIRIGDTVLNAVGTGTVTDIVPTRRDRLVEIEVAGEVFHCTPEHPFFTACGWVSADQLGAGDSLHDPATVRDLWRDLDDAEAAAVLLEEVLGGLGQGELSGLRAVRGSHPGAAADDLLARLRRSQEAGAQPATRDGLPVLRQGDRQRQGQLPVLQPGLLERQQGADGRVEDLPGMRRGVQGHPAARVLLAELLSEVSGDRLRRDRQGRVDRADLQAMWRGLRNLGPQAEVLLDDVRECATDGQPPAPEAMRAVRRGISAASSDPCLVQQGVLVRQQGQVPATEGGGRTPEGLRARRSSRSAVHALAGAGRRMAAAVLALPAGLVGRGESDRTGSCASGDPGRGRSGRQQPPGQGAADQGPDPRRLAALARVDRAEILEPGSPGFARLSGGEDQVTVYDLTVSGHPSYFVGQQGFLVHNCVRINESTWASEYNDNVYAQLKIEGEQLERQPIESFLTFPANHKAAGYTSYWAGLDVGFTNDPSELLVFGQVQVKDKDVLRLLSRIHMLRVSAPDQETVIAKVFDFYGDRLRALSMDKTGNGLPVWQHMAFDPAHKAYRERVKGYGFSEKKAVEFDDRPLEMREKPEDAVIEKNVIEYATDQLRAYVDAGMVELPYDRELLSEFQGQTVLYVRDDADVNRRRTRYGGGSFHTLDAAKLMILGKELEAIEAVLAPKRRRGPVLDRFAV